MPPRKRKSPSIQPAFAYRAGITLPGTPVTCDGPGFPSDLVFLSHSRVLDSRTLARFTRNPAGRRRILTTPATLSLFGEVGENLRKMCLSSMVGRPFDLGEFRMGLVPTGYQPGSAGLLIEKEGRTHYYVGCFCPETLSPSAPAAEVRPTHALCLDATYAHPRFVFPPRFEVLEELRDFVVRAAGSAKIPVVAISTTGPIAAVVRAIHQGGLKIRAHTRFLPFHQRLAVLEPDLPHLHRFSGKIDIGECLLWPRELLGSFLPQPSMVTAFVSGLAADSHRTPNPLVAKGFPLSNRACHAELCTFIKESGAREVALMQGDCESFAAEISTRTRHAYVIANPQQMVLLGE
jgi:putative mRNA 3-end processing factor